MENWNSMTVNKIVNIPTISDPIFKFWSCEGNITFFFFWPKNNNIVMQHEIFIQKKEAELNHEDFRRRMKSNCWVLDNSPSH